MWKVLFKAWSGTRNHSAYNKGTLIMQMSRLSKLIHQLILRDFLSSSMIQCLEELGWSSPSERDTIWSHECVIFSLSAVRMRRCALSAVGGCGRCCLSDNRPWRLYPASHAARSRWHDGCLSSNRGTESWEVTRVGEKWKYGLCLVSRHISSVLTRERNIDRRSLLLLLSRLSTFIVVVQSQLLTTRWLLMPPGQWQPWPVCFQCIYWYRTILVNRLSHQYLHGICPDLVQTFTQTRGRSQCDFTYVPRSWLGCHLRPVHTELTIGRR